MNRFLESRDIVYRLSSVSAYIHLTGLLLQRVRQACLLVTTVRFLDNTEMIHQNGSVEYRPVVLLPGERD